MRLWVEPSVIDEIAALPGNIRQRVRRSIRELAGNPRPPSSRTLDTPKICESRASRRSANGSTTGA